MLVFIHNVFCVEKLKALVHYFFTVEPRYKGFLKVFSLKKFKAKSNIVKTSITLYYKCI